MTGRVIVLVAMLCLMTGCSGVRNGIHTDYNYPIKVVGWAHFDTHPEQSSAQGPLTFGLREFCRQRNGNFVETKGTGTADRHWMFGKCQHANSTTGQASPVPALRQAQE